MSIFILFGKYDAQTNFLQEDNDAWYEFGSRLFQGEHCLWTLDEHLGFTVLYITTKALFIYDHFTPSLIVTVIAGPRVFRDHLVSVEERKIFYTKIKQEGSISRIFSKIKFRHNAVNRRVSF